MIPTASRATTPLRATTALLMLGIGAAAGVTAQEPVPGGHDPVERVGSSDVALDRRLARLLDADPVILTRDTHVRAGDTIRGSVLVLDATLVHEGVITGDLVMVDAGAFVRPRSVVGGDLVNIAGGLYRSEIARVGGTIIDLPTASYRVIREPDRIVIEASGSPARLTLDRFMGFHVPAYDRVNGLTLAWGARYRLPRIGDLTPSVHGQVGWLTRRGDPTYGASFRLRGFATALELGYERGWATNDDWIKSDSRNALNYVWDGDDFRDYHDAEWAWLGLSRDLGDEAKSFFGVLGVRLEVEDARSLSGGEPWHLWPGEVRPNPEIDEGRITSVIASYDMEWHGLETDFEGGIEYEAGRDWLDGQYAFDRIAAVGDFAMHALADHTLEIEFFAQTPLGGGALPRQEWSFVGGSGTLQTVEFARHYGDRVVFVETTYIVPAPERVALPLLGAPDLELVHGVGLAWVQGDETAFEQEIGARLQFFGLYFRYMIDPADPRAHDLDIGLSWPFGGRFPWQRR